MSSGLALEAEGAHGGRWKRYPAYRDSGVEWIGEVPEEWEILTLRRVVSRFVDYRGKTPEKVDSGVPLITAKNIKGGHIDLSSSKEFIRENEYQDWMTRGLPENGDVLITTEAPLGEVAQVESTYIALAQRIILLKVKKSRITNSYLKYHFLSKSGQGELWTQSSGSTALGIKADRFKGTLVSVPSHPEQRAIAAFLDHETGRIDALIAKKERQIDLLREKRAALISHAVTKGLDPDAPMKDSGVEWLGEVPEHWNIVHLKRVFHSTDYGISESLQADGVYGILRMGDIQDGEILMDDLGYVDSVAQELLLDQGDLVFNRTNSLALVGKVGIFRGTIEDNISFASYLVRLRIKDTSDPEYFNYMLNRPEVLSKASSMALPSIGQANLNPNRYGYLRICAPPKKEQYEIARFLRDKTCKIDRLKEKINGSISKLREYRTALISAAVTGKIDVREESAP